jgi:hypothetical protein
MKGNSLANFRRALTIALAIMLAPLALCYAALYFMFTVPENNIRQSLNIYPEATAVFEESARYGADMYHKKLYYWTQAPIEDVQRHYEGVFQPFIASQDDDGGWLISAYHLDGSIPKADANFYSLSHSSFCLDFQDNRCVSVALVDAKQPDLYKLRVANPTSFRRDVSPPELANIPFKGTVIIYSHWFAGV